MADSGAAGTAGERGQLMVIGGAERRDAGAGGILGRFVALAGGPAADIAVVATASAEPKVLEDEYVAAFTRLGAGRAHAVPVATRADANSAAAVEALGCCTGIFFTGGDQRKIIATVGGSEVDSLLHRRVDAGEVVLAGTSAGAAMMSATMVRGGRLDSVSTEAVQTGPGLEFVSGVLIDMHFAERGRLNRLLSAIALYPHELGLGIDEDTAIVVAGGCFDVIGTGAVTVIDAGRAAMIRTPVEGEGLIALSGVELHVLPGGHRFDLGARQPVTGSAPANTQDWGTSA
ncbi:cyanophycinase [Pilimelia terevasa]|uniref:Cyanophycinase n=1 Tax=Pilimelia terevasa TaxID=53372 RepID=A0A8J3BGD8_9ACTN|nr:cyanophycinase [Pilimelia terevasa]GGK17610.1 cyanophycinase [Pilimelia terevasa]